MTHLSPEQMLDIAEGVPVAAVAPHLEACAACRRQVDELRATAALAVSTIGDDVPEPSPLFWDHLSARVRDAVAAEETPRPIGWAWWLTVAAGAMAAVVLATGLAIDHGASSVPRQAVAVSGAAGGDEAVAATDDAELAMMAGLAADMDAGEAQDAGLSLLTGNIGGADDSVGTLSDAERRELQRLLREALAGTGAQPS